MRRLLLLALILSPVSALAEGRGQPRLTRGLRAPTAGATDEARARGFLARHPSLAGGARLELRLQAVQALRELRVVRFQQLHGGLPVFGATVTVTLDREGNVRAVSSEASAPTGLPALQPRLGALQATAAALARVAPGAHTLPEAGRAQLGILDEGAARLVYRVTLPLTVDPRGRFHLIDAATGRYLGWRRGVLMEGRP